MPKAEILEHIQHDCVTWRPCSFQYHARCPAYQNVLTHYTGWWEHNILITRFITSILSWRREREHPLKKLILFVGFIAWRRTHDCPSPWCLDNSYEVWFPLKYCKIYEWDDRSTRRWWLAQNSERMGGILRGKLDAGTTCSSVSKHNRTDQREGSSTSMSSTINLCNYEIVRWESSKDRAKETKTSLTIKDSAGFRSLRNLAMADCTNEEYFGFGCWNKYNGISVIFVV